ncbi:hypothetical protein GL213_11800 [Halogeometricum borinquense]|uniref:DUF7314 domain-containing protein n=2 Tax=Halogeometricum borinquense TaxID=60847 RepID=E4NR97_HALBP|nr:hypothetical protein [Halogeometricum borinquense]ADQ67938.1 hypothetical protein Hbor_23790 [Halogeometricum borinquense DSM 11551]ELY24142.1 hypothetical protein C499_16552 [Halogeometricum borinquense DSM 11551]QIB73450.1 hypothetical protein G3I44_03610 [Halogeometricum borinquense]QIQ77148.1 hypothetical protein GL213_11800 [Halogeometricum borinquense]RYJ13171.1 hypothetical protein ELS19_03740 [Halogeometricum borinquense]
MADEFIKGLGIFTAAGLGWMVLAGWYRTSSFESNKQLIEAVSGGGTVFDSLGILLMDSLFWFALLGILAFWVLIPVGRQMRAAIEERRA